MCRIYNLSVGSRIKNYSEMCKILNEPAKTGNAKTIQLKSWERYFKYHKEGHTFVIDEIYEIPLPKIDNRKTGNNSIYVEEIGDILVNYIYENGDADNKVILSFSKLINILGLVNNTYTIGNSRKKELSDLLNIKLQVIHYFYNASRGEFKEIIKKSLNNLKNRGVIFWNEKIMICEEKTIKNVKTYNYRLAADWEIELIIDTQKFILTHLGYKNFQELFLSGIKKYKEFIKLVMSELPRTWKFYFNTYEIIYGKNAIKLERELIKEKILALNKKSMNKLDKTFGILSDSNNEKKLIDVLIDLLKYDFNIDEQLIQLHEENIDKKYNRISNNTNKVNELLEDNKKAVEEYENRDNFNEFDYYSYLGEIKDRKILKKFLDNAENIDIE